MRTHIREWAAAAFSFYHSPVFRIVLGWIEPTEVGHPYKNEFPEGAFIEHFFCMRVPGSKTSEIGAACL